TMQGMDQLVGAINLVGVKGVRYPQSAVDTFRRLITAQDAGLITPKTAVAWLTQSPTALIDYEPNDDVELIKITLAHIAELLLAHISPPDDRLLRREEAAQLLACYPGSVRRFVKPIRRGRWRRSDVLRYIA